MNNRCLVRVLFCLLALSCVGLFAQTSGTIRGTVKGPSGEVIPNAATTLTHSSGASQSVLTGPDGTFTATSLQPGLYRVEVESQGFKRVSLVDVEVTPNETSVIEISLEPGSTSDTVLVQGHASPLQSSNADNARTYNGEFLRQLPFLFRNQQLIAVQVPGIPGTSQDVSPLLDPQRNFRWTADGLPRDSNYHGLDGVQNDLPVDRIEVHLAPLESVQQFQVTTSNYDASQGRAGGSLAQTLLRQGTNQFHGSLFEFNSNSYLRARDFFNPKGLNQSRWNFNMFGATVGGPIIKNKTFLFGAWETRFFRQDVPTVATVPTAALRAGNFSGVPGLTLFDPLTGNADGSGRQQFTGNQIPANRLNATSQALLNSIPQPNQSGFENNLFGNVPFRNDNTRFNARIDHHFNDKTSVFARYGYTNGTAVQSSVLGAIGSNANGRLRSDSVALNGTHAFGASLVGELRIGYSRYNNNIFSTSAVNAANFGFLGTDGTSAGNGTIPFIQIGGMPALGQFPNLPQQNSFGGFNLVNAWSKQFRRHDIRWGADIWWTRLDGFNTLAFSPQGGFQFAPGTTMTTGSTPGPFGDFANSFAGFLLAAPSVSGVGTNGARPSNLMTSVAGYVADNFKVTSRLTLNLGLRYDYFSPFRPRNSAGVSIFDPQTNTLLPIGTNGIDAFGNVGHNNTNFAPRVGFAYRVTERTVVRGGYGISYWNVPPQFAAQSFITGDIGLQNGVPSNLTVAPSYNQLAAVPPLSNATGAAPNFPFSLMPTNVPTPYVQNYSIMVQQDLGNGRTVDVSYAGTLGRHLPFIRDLNAAFPGTGINGLPFNQTFGRTSATLQDGTGVNSNFNGLLVNFTQRFWQGLTMNVSYTYSHSFDFGNGLLPLLNNLDVRSNYGPSDFDRKHSVAIAHAWELPFGKGHHLLSSGWKSHVAGGWGLNGVFRYGSGLPFTPTASAVECACPGNTALANVALNSTGTVPSGNFPSTIQVSPTRFAQPPAGSLGNVGRNIARGQSFTNYDLAVTRNLFAIEKMRLELRGEAYNIANAAHLALPVTNVNSAFFGQSTSTTFGLGPRTFQFALRFLF